MKIMAEAMIRMMSKNPKAPSTRWRRANPCPPARAPARAAPGDGDAHRQLEPRRQGDETPQP